MTTETQSCAKKGRGRPKVFDREAALDKAMTLFWQHGYEATSLSDLVEATGAKAPTLYAEFVNKEGLFRAVLDHYIAHFAAKHEAKLCCDDKPVDEALNDYFTAVATCYTSKDTPAGCFMINTSAALAASSKEIAKNQIPPRRSGTNAARVFTAYRQEKGEIPAGKEVKELALFLSFRVLQGMSISAREGASFDTLTQITRTTLGLWPHMLGE